MVAVASAVVFISRSRYPRVCGQMARLVCCNCVLRHSVGAVGDERIHQRILTGASISYSGIGTFLKFIHTPQPL